ncbi:MAG: retropepsin-like aspartic protease [Gammaproteobacteria bacterium]
MPQARPQLSAKKASRLQPIFRSVAMVWALMWAVSIQAETPYQSSLPLDLLVPLDHSGTGSFVLQGEMGGVKGEFLLDTGASMVTINQELFREIRKLNDIEKVRTVGARLASGKIELMDVYRSENFIIGSGCDLGAVEFAVGKRGGRNLLGMNALQQAAPFTISMTPPQLSLSHCVLR